MTPLQYILTNAYKKGMMAYMESHPEDFEELIDFALKDEQPYSWRSAWLLSNCVLKNDRRVQPFIPQIIHTIKTGNDSQKRDLINVLRKMEIPEAYEGKLYDLCVNIWCQLGKMPSVRFNALRLMLQITEKNPELFTEVALLTQEDYIDSLSLGIQRSVQRMVKKYQVENS